MKTKLALSSRRVVGDDTALLLKLLLLQLGSYFSAKATPHVGSDGADWGFFFA